VTTGGAEDLRDILLRDYQPRSCLVVPEHTVERPRFPAIDAHNHLGRWLSADGDWVIRDVPALLALMDECGVTGMVNLDGRWGDELEANLDRYDRAYPGRFATFCHVDWREATSAGFTERVVASLRRSAAAGAKGFKVWKDLGLHFEDPAGKLLMPDDPRLSPVWETAGELGLPIMIHTADPVAFFHPIDRFNERLEELLRHPEWSFCDPRFPSFQRLMDALEAIVAAHPATTFIGAHVGCYSENLQWVSRMCETHPNFNVDICARINELGRQPRAARDLMTRHPDRVLFGTDVFPPVVDWYRLYFRFLETADEYFPYQVGDAVHRGRWRMSAVDLPDDALRLVYRENARRLVPCLGASNG
jgi:predicted TIM-barrel fold metal-dependent hydrolase